MKAIKYFTCFLFLLSLTEILPQDQKILVFDPNGISSAFQYSFSQLSDDSVFVADSIDDSIFNFDALFLFINHPYVLSQDESNKLIEYTSDRKPVYVYSELFSQPLDSVSFWKFIGINWYALLLTTVPVDSIVGVDTTFTKDSVIDTNFISPGIPWLEGNMYAILEGFYEETAWLNTTFNSGVYQLNVILDLYNLIHHPEFLSRVIENFGLSSNAPLIQFFPETDTAWVIGGCVGPDIYTHNLVSTPVRDSITIEPGPNSYFFYYDSSGQQVFTDKYYFIVIDSLNEYEYKLWFHPKSWPPFNPVLIPFDSLFYFFQNLFEIQLVVKSNGNRIDSLSQLFRAEWGLNVGNNGELPENFTLYQNYPNPFNPTTKIKFQIADFGFVNLKVYDILGNEIATLVNEEKQPGIYEVKFTVGQSAPADSPEISSGIYFYQLQIGSYIETKKMVLMK